MTYTPVGSQVDVIACTARVLVVLGGAGTGKTSTAAAAARAHLKVVDDEHVAARRAAMGVGQRTRLPPQARALFLSFSRTAVAQVVDRASNVIGTYMQRLDVSTFHGFAWRIINDFGVPHGYPRPLAVLSTASSRVPGAPQGLTYAQLIPAAVAILQQPAVAAHYAARYSLVICDEFQDTSDLEWTFLQLIAPDARRILLGDLNQCIYGGLKNIDPAARVDLALALPGARCVELPPVSHRDPTGVLPAAADAARRRSFTDPAIRQAASTGRLAVTRTSGGDGHAQVVALTRQAQQRKHSVSIFTHTIAATGALSDALTEAGLVHEQVGFGEAFGEALAAQLALLRFAIDGQRGIVRRALAVYITANAGGKDTSPPPPLAMQILDGSNDAIERALLPLATDLFKAGAAPPDLDRLADVIAATYARIGTHRGQETWVSAAQRARSAMGLLATGQTLDAVAAELQRVRDDSLVGAAGHRPRPVQVMNLHQTKGREADSTILLLQPEEFHGYESEPYPSGSRLLYVVMTRARHQAHIVVPENPHPLWQPLVAACERAQRP